MNAAEIPMVIELASGLTTGVLHLPSRPEAIGVVCLTGVGQTRTGPNRLNVLLAREWAASGFPVLRFDYGGNGDSSGAVLPYHRAGDDVRRGIDALIAEVPDLTGVVLWGVCGAGSAAAAYGVAETRVKGLMVANPPIHNLELIHLRHAAKLWLARGGRRRFAKSVRAVLGRLAVATWVALETVPASAECIGIRQRLLSRASDSLGSLMTWLSARGNEHADKILFRRRRREQFIRALSRFSGRSLFLLSDDDPGATTFIRTVLQRNALEEEIRLDRMTCYPVKRGGHTFARQTSREDVARITSEWLLRLSEQSGQRPPSD